MKQRIVFSAIVFLCTLLCLESLVYTPQRKTEYIHNENDIIAEYTVEDSNLVEYDKNEAGGIYISGETPVLDFSVENMESRYVTIRLTEEVSYHVLIQVYFDCGDGYTESNTVNVTVPTASKYAYITIPEGCSSFVIRTPGTISFDALELHDAPPEVHNTKVKMNVLYVVLAFFASVGTAFIFYYYDRKRKFSIRICVWFLDRKTCIKRIIIKVLLSGLICCLVEVLLAKTLFAYFRFASSFNYVTALYMWSICVLFIFVNACQHYIVDRLEVVVTGCILIMGVTMMLVSPFAHTGWDVDTHYHLALQDSYIGETIITQADMDIMTARYDFLSKGDRASNMYNVIHMNDIYKLVVDTEASGFSLPHLPAGIGMAVGRTLHLPFYGIYLMGELANLLVYSCLIYLALRRLKNGKTLLAIIALFPTNIFIACNFSYDYWVTGFSLLGMAYFIGELQRKEKITGKNMVIMCSSFALACVPKQIYVPLLLIPFFMPKEKIKSRKKYYILCILFILFLFASLIFASVQQTTGGGDTRGSTAVNPSEQLTFILTNLLHYLVQLVLYLKDYLSVTSCGQYISNFANLGYVGIGSTVYVVLVLIAATTDWDKNAIKNIKWWLKGYMLLMYIGLGALIATAFYMVYTPVGADYIAGCQGRYLMPMLYPMLAVLASGKIINHWDKGKYYKAMLYACSIVIYLDIACSMLIRML